MPKLSQSLKNNFFVKIKTLLNCLLCLKTQCRSKWKVVIRQVAIVLKCFLNCSSSFSDCRGMFHRTCELGRSVGAVSDCGHSLVGSSTGSLRACLRFKSKIDNFTSR